MDLRSESGPKCHGSATLTAALYTYNILPFPLFSCIGILLEVFLPDGRGDGAGEQVGVVARAVAHQVGEAQLGRGAGHVGQGVVLPLHTLQHTARALALPKLTVVGLKKHK
jgi:hypothetical protein